MSSDIKRGLRRESGAIENSEFLKLMQLLADASGNQVVCGYEDKSFVFEKRVDNEN